MLDKLVKKLEQLNILIACIGVEEEELKENSSECIVYSYVPVSKIQGQLRIRIIAKTLDRCLEIEKQMEELMLGNGDKVKVEKCTKIIFGAGSVAKEKITNTVQLLFNIEVWGYR